MKIAIIGGGFYGSFLAYKLSSRHQVTLFERDAELMGRSATINQSRLHRGLHYPRSLETIGQTNYGFFKFKEDFFPFVKTLDKNIYAIHKTSKTSLTDFEKTMLSYDIQLKRYPGHALIKSPEDFQAFIETDEMVIDLAGIKKFLETHLKNKIILKLNSTIFEVEAESGKIDNETFDFIINTTFTNPNLGLPVTEHFSLCYEMAAMVCLTPPTQKCEGVTIVDGDFVSLFPNYNQEVTLSSVIYTPFFKTTDLKELEDCWQTRFEQARKADVQEKIIIHGKSLLKLDQIKNPHLWIAPKVKLMTVHADDRPTRLKRHHQLISVFCSKLDSVYVILKEIEGIL